jgi:predicted transglutaminase-like cysteine proteinase
MALSENLRSEIEKKPELEILGDAWDMPYDADGNVENILLHKRLRELAGLPDPALAAH